MIRSKNTEIIHSSFFSSMIVWWVMCVCAVVHDVVMLCKEEVRPKKAFLASRFSHPIDFKFKLFP